MSKSKRGFASMNAEQRRKIASQGGLAVSQNKEHMSAIGRRGGELSGQSRRNAKNAQEAIEEPAVAPV